MRLNAAPPCPGLTSTTIILKPTLPHALLPCCLSSFARSVLGFWIALTICTALQALAFAVLISRFDWRNEVRRAHALLTATHRAAMSSS